MSKKNKTKINPPVLTTTPVVPIAQYSRHILQSGAYKFYEMDTLGQGFSIAALDDGMANHDQWVDSTPKRVLRSFVPSASNPKVDNHNHGTCISSLLIGGKSSDPSKKVVGFAPKVSNYYHAKVWGNSMIVLDDVAAALDWFLWMDKGIRPDFVNMSLGEHFPQPWADDIKNINSKMEKLNKETGMLFFVAASNSGQTTDKCSWLAELPFTICVGACTFGEQPGYLSPENELIDIVSYGIGIEAYSNRGYGYTTFDGTSQSSPIAMGFSTAAASYLIQSGRGYKKDDFKYKPENLLNIFKKEKMLVDIGAPGEDNNMGAGILRFA